MDTVGDGAMMLTLLRVGFWSAAVMILYAYALYPLAVALAAQLLGRRAAAPETDAFRGTFSVVLAAHNEAERIRPRLAELVRLVAASGSEGEIVVVADGCTDQTVSLARSGGSDLVRVLELAANGGKALALSRGATAARGDILVFADARQRWADDALVRLLSNFARPEVGAVSGELVIEAAPGLLAGVGLYWRYEKWLRRNEGRLHSMVGVTGAISAVRRELFRPIPPGLVLDDVYWPLRVAMQGRRVVYDETAIAFDRLPDGARHEFRRKLRTLSGNFQLFAALPEALLPGRNPIFWQLLSHKLLRLVVPWLLLVMLAASACLPGRLYRALFAAQVVGYGLALAGLVSTRAARFRIVSTAASFVVLNAAAWAGFWVWAGGGSRGAWQKVRYRSANPID